MKQIQKVSVQTPLPIQLLFLLMIALGAVWFLFSYQYTSASSIDCRTEFYNWFFQEIDPVIYKQCWKKFAYFTRLEIKRMKKFATFK